MARLGCCHLSRPWSVKREREAEQKVGIGLKLAEQESAREPARRPEARQERERERNLGVKEKEDAR
jgi:hypothetical protein